MLADIIEKLNAFLIFLDNIYLSKTFIIPYIIGEVIAQTKENKKVTAISL